MGVFSKFDPKGVGNGGVLKQAHPNVHSYPWIPLQTTVRPDNQWGGAGKVHRVGPHERGKHFSSTQLGSWQNQAAGTIAAAPTMSSGSGGACGGCGGCKGMSGGAKSVNRKP